MGRWLAIGLCSLALMGRCASSKPAAPGPPAESSLVVALNRALADQTLFGPDLAAALRLLPAFAAAGEERVMLFPDRIAGGKSYATVEEGQRAAKSLTAVEAVRLLDDRQFHVTAVLPGKQLLAPGLNIDVVQQRLGPAEKQEQLVIDDGSDRAPVVLEVYSYFGGAIAFATRAGTVDPRKVDRVFLDVPRIIAAVS